MCTYAQAVVRPLENHGGKRRVWHKILLLWLLAAICAIPQPMFYVYTEQRSWSAHSTQPVSYYKCKTVAYAGNWKLKTYSTLLTSFLFTIPTGVMTFCYVKITRVVWLRASLYSASTAAMCGLNRLQC